MGACIVYIMAYYDTYSNRSESQLVWNFGSLKNLNDKYSSQLQINENLQNEIKVCRRIEWIKMWEA